MAWDEWEQLKGDAAQRRAPHTQINSASVDGGYGQPAGQGDLKVSQKDLAAVGDSAWRLYGDLDHWGDHARIASMTAADGLKSEGFALGGGLDHVAEHWVDQVQTLLDACGHIANHLQFTKRVHANDEVHIAGTISSIAQLDKGFDDSGFDGKAGT